MKEISDKDKDFIVMVLSDDWVACMMKLGKSDLGVIDRKQTEERAKRDYSLMKELDK
jgi:hypothetical protein